MQQSLICDITQQNTDAFLEHLKKTLKNYFSPIHSSWISSIEISSHNAELVTFKVAQHSFLDAINRNKDKFDQVFHREYQSFFNSKCNLLFTVETPVVVEGVQDVSPNTFKKPTHLEPKFTFETFITTNENIFTRMNVENVANKIKEGQSGNFFCVTGTIGNGKTHLMQAVGNAVEKHTSVQYMTSERFMFLYTKAVAQRDLIRFREAITETKLLLIDDIHFILAKDGTMKELASIVRYMLSFGGNVVITSATSIHLMQGLTSEIQSTFSKANVVNIENPSTQLRYEILAYKNRAFSYNVSKEVITMLADKISSSVRDLETTFDKIILHGRILNSEIDVNAAKIVLKEIFPSAAFKTVSIKTILETICNFYGLKKEDILSQSRLKELVTARQMGMYLALEMTNETAKKIGFEFGGRTHSTVIHAYKTIKQECEEHNHGTVKNIDLLKVQIYSA